MITFGSLFSGIGGFDLGFKRAGMWCAWQCEIDAVARGVLTRQFGKPIIEDVRDVRRDNVPVDLVCGGFPCQDLSVAGKRAGLAGERSGLWFEFRRVLDELRPQWVVIENVPGLLSSRQGRDFAVILRGLVELRYGVAWRVLDAQYFGVAQRRRRVFIVGSLGDGRAAQVLFESEGMFGDPPARRKAGQGVAGTLKGGAFEPRYARNGRGAPDTIAPPLKAENGQTGKGDGAPVVAFANVSDGSSARSAVDSAPPLTRRHGDPGSVAGSFGIRRLTPTECERLQGFPDGWTAGQSDSARYRQLGNAVAVPVIEWIGRRIIEADGAGVPVPV